MVELASHPEQTSVDVTALESRGWKEWTDDERLLFIAYVEERKATGEWGAVKRACERFKVKTVTLGYWRKTLRNGDAHASNGNGDPGHAPPENGALVETASPALRVATTQEEVRSEIGQLMDRADELAMQLEKKDHPLAEALGTAVMTVRFVLEQLDKEGTVMEQPLGKTKEELLAVLFAPSNATAESAPDSTESQPEEEPLEEGSADTAVEEVAPEPATQASPEASARVHAETAAHVPEPIDTPPAAIAPIPSMPATETVRAQHDIVAPLPAPITGTHGNEEPINPKERAMRGMEASLGGVTAKYERLVEMTVEAAMRRFEAAHGNPGWSLKQSYERRVRDCIARYEPSRDGHALHFIERMATANRETPGATQRVRDFGRAHNPKAFQIAHAYSKKDDLPAGITHEFLKTEAFRTMGYLASIYDERRCGDFWIWAEPNLKKVLGAACGEGETSFFSIGAKRENGGEADNDAVAQQPLAKRLQEDAIGQQLWIKEVLGDKQRHAAMLSYINGLAVEGRAETMEEVFRAVLERYMNDIERLASQLHDERYKQTIEECMMVLMRSTLKSVWLFDPRRGGSLDDYIRNGWELELRK